MKTIETLPLPGQAVGVTKLKDIVFDCENAATLARFWAAALDDYEIRPYDDAEIQRLATVGLTPEADYVDHTVMADPQGNEFCLYDQD
jgi:hypothetical protein